MSLEPGLTVDDNTLKPQIVVSTKKPFFNVSDVSVLFDFSVNGGIDTGNYENPQESSEGENRLLRNAELIPRPH